MEILLRMTGGLVLNQLHCCLGGTQPIITGFAVVMTSGIITTGMLISQTWPYYAAATLASLHLVWQVNRVIQPHPQMCALIFR